MLAKTGFCRCPKIIPMRRGSWLLLLLIVLLPLRAWSFAGMAVPAAAVQELQVSPVQTALTGPGAAAMPHCHEEAGPARAGGERDAGRDGDPAPAAPTCESCADCELCHGVSLAAEDPAQAAASPVATALRAAPGATPHRREAEPFFKPPRG